MLVAPGGGLYGITQYGGGDFIGFGTTGYDVLFQLNKGGTVAVLHSFHKTDGFVPNTIVLDSTGTIIGSTAEGGTPCGGRYGCGTTFSFTPRTRTFVELHQFTGKSDGSYPLLGSIGSNNVVYGVTAGGPYGSTGTLFAMSPSTNYRLTELTTISDKPPCSSLAGGPTLLFTGQLVVTTSSDLCLYDPAVPHQGFAFLQLPQSSYFVTQPFIGPNGTLYGTETGATSNGLIYSYTPPATSP